MSDLVKITLIVALTAVICTGLLIYFSETQSCKRKFGDVPLCYQ